MELFEAHQSLARHLVVKVDDGAIACKQTCRTYTLVSVKDMAKGLPYHLLIVTDGHNQSIADYEWTGVNYSWRVSTIHTKQPGLLTSPLDSLVPASPEFPTHYVAKVSNETSYHNTQFHQLSDNTPMYLYKDLKLERMGDGIRFSLTSSNEELDAIFGDYEEAKVF